MRTRAAVLYELGQPLHIEELEIPPLRFGQVLVKVSCSGVCQSQVMEVRGKRGPDRYLPHLLGHEGAGLVVDIGTGVTKVRPGDRVVLTWIKGHGTGCGGSQFLMNGQLVNAGAVTTFSDYTVVSENRCAKLPDGVPMDVGALFGCAVLTGAGVVLNTMHPSPDNSIVIWGVGGVGLSAVMAAKLCQCTIIIAVDVQGTKLDLARAFGATHIIDDRAMDALLRILEIAGEGGVDFAFEAAGHASTIERAFQAVRKGGGLCVFASHPPVGERICLEPHDLISGKHIRGTWGGESRPDEDIPRFAALYCRGKLPLEQLITKRYTLNQINQALKELENGTIGRPLIEMDIESVL